MAMPGFCDESTGDASLQRAELNSLLDVKCRSAVALTSSVVRGEKASRAAALDKKSASAKLHNTSIQWSHSKTISDYVPIILESVGGHGSQRVASAHAGPKVSGSTPQQADLAEVPDDNERQ